MSNFFRIFAVSKMNNFKPKKFSVKKSSGGQSKELLKTLQKVLLTEEGTVSYYFEEYRVENIHSQNPKEVKRESILHVNLTPESLRSSRPGEKKTPNEMIHMLETTKWDLGATRFVIH